MNHQDLEQTIGYTFRDAELLLTALTHSSYANEKGEAADNERLEFLGDAVLELYSSEFLFTKYPDKPEGELTRLRASLVCEEALAEAAGNLSLGDVLRLGKGEDQTGGRKRKSVLSDALEALIGAMYLDGGGEAARSFILKFVMTDLERKELFYDSKTKLQEKVQEVPGQVLSYRILSETGPDHDRSYVAAALIGDEIVGQGSGKTKKAAEQEAAYQALLSLK